MEGNAIVQDDEKALLRANILVGLADALPRIRSLIAAAVAKIANADWPTHWPDVFDSLLAMLGAGEPCAVHGVLRCLDDFARTMKEDHMPSVIPVLFPELLRIFANADGAYSLRDQMRAVSIYSTCLETLFPVLKTHAEAAMDLLKPTLADFIAGFDAVLSAPDAEGADCGLKIAVLQAVHVFILRYAKYIGEAMAPLMSPIWNGIVSGTAFFERAVLAELEKPIRYSDGEPRSFEYQLSSMFSVVQVLALRGKFRTAVAESLESLMYVLVFYFQLTNDQLEGFDSEPSLFLEDEDEMNVRRHSVRQGADDLLGELMLIETVGEEFAMAAVAALLGGALRRLEESAAMRAAGQPDWWRIHEAALFALGRCADEILELVERGHVSFDVASFLQTILLPDLAIDTSPYLLGRALWLAAFFARVVPAELADAFVLASLAGMSNDNAMPVRVCATKAMFQLCCTVDKALLAPHVPAIVHAILALATNRETGALPLVVQLLLQTLHAALRVNEAAAASVESLAGPYALAIWIKHCDEPLLVNCAKDVFEVLVTNAEASQTFAQRIIPTVLSILDQGPEGVGSYGIVVSACAVLGDVIEATPQPLGELVALAAPALCNACLASSDNQFMQTATRVLRVLLRRASLDELQAPIGDATPVDMVLACIAKLLSPDTSDDGAVEVGLLVVTTIKALGTAVSDYLARILEAVIERLCVARYLPLIQSLVTVFAYLINTQGQTAVIDFLAGYTCTGTGANGLATLIAIWLENESHFSGEYGMRASLTALVTLLAPMDPRVQECCCEEELVDVAEPVMTRAQRAAASAPIKTFALPAPIKIFQLLVRHFKHIADDVEAGGDGRHLFDGRPDSEDDGYSDDGDGDSDDDFYEAAQGLGLRDEPLLGPPGRGRPTFVDRDAFLLTDALDMGLDYEQDDDDPEFADDPLLELRIGQYLTAFCRAFNEQDPATFRAMANFLPPDLVPILDRALAGEFDL